MDANEFILFDRIEKIKQINVEYDLENNSYVSFSGGKDSTILHYLIDLALPNNNIPRVFINTGIEYNAIVEFVKDMQKTDHRIIIINSNVNIKQMLEKYGYPFKSKEHSLKVRQWQNGSRVKSIIYYKEMQGKSKYACPKKLLYQYDDDFKIKLSDKCCYKLKKEPILKWQRENNKSITITGMRKAEGGHRENMTCIVTKKDKVVKFHPLAVVTEKFEDWFIKRQNIKLCKLYYPPYNFKRTGCKGCPYALDLKMQLEILKLYMPSEYNQCWSIWKPVYEEYQRIGYRGFRKYEQMKLF
jgi:3'-phosphoadenosine 5'-phosphosulfate sulfotransferase (PAPS reductase)/FAD synthetase